MNIELNMNTGNLNRTGITIVEVLTSIIVAVIGVAGVLVLIPFGIRQAETGLDLDDSIAMADNSFAQFEITGYRIVDDNGNLPWINIDRYADYIPVPPGTQGFLVNTNSIKVDPPVPGTNNVTDSFFIIDPLWTNRQPNNGAIGIPRDEFFDSVFAQPRAGFGPAILRLLPEYVTLYDPAADALLSDALARRLFSTGQDLQFATSTDPLTGLDIEDGAPPRPYLDLDPARVGDGTDNDLDGTIDEADEAVLRRQTLGQLTWSAIAVPRRDIGINAVDSMDFYMLIYKDRSFADPVGFSGDADSDPRMRLTEVPSANNPPIFRSGGRVTVASPIDIADNSWVMMANFHRLTGELQAGFYRVLGSNPESQSISLSGPDFEMDDPGDNTTTTIMIYFPKVVSVYGRSMLLERDSVYSQQ